MTPPFRSILLGLDLDPRTQTLSSGSHAAVEEALWLARGTGARLDVAHSTATDGYIEEHGRVFRLSHEGLSDRGGQALEEVSARIASEGHGGRLHLHTEKPWVSITRQVFEGDIDLVVVGRHDGDKPTRPLGSVSLKLIQNCPCGVWAVKSGVPTVPRRILVGSDLSEVAVQALRLGAVLAGRSGAELHVVHAFQIPLGGEMVPGREVTGQLSQLREQAIGTLREQAERVGCESEPRLHVVCTTPYRGIRSAAAEVDPDVLVLGTISRGGLPGLLIGNTAEKVLRKLDYSLLTVKPEDFVSPLAGS